jgi:flagellar capping protein FliD
MSYETILEDRELTLNEMACIWEQIEYHTTVLGISTVCWWSIAKKCNIPYLSVKRDGMAMERANIARQVASNSPKEAAIMSSSSSSHHESIYNSGNVQHIPHQLETTMNDMQQRQRRLETTIKDMHQSLESMMNDVQQRQQRLENKITEIHQLCRFCFFLL